MKPKVSIIVPIYNVERYLPACIDSLTKQTLVDIEILLVNDCSPDGCGNIAAAAALSDHRIRVIARTARGGLGPARNSGLEHVRGDYIGFVDSDDWIEPTMYEALYQAACSSGADIVYTGLKKVSGGAVIERELAPYSNSLVVGERDIFQFRKNYFGPPPSKSRGGLMTSTVMVGLYRTSLVQKNNLRFLNIRGEDKFFNTIACRAAQSIYFIPGEYYCYRKDDQPSITKTFDGETVESFIEMFEGLRALANQEALSDLDECLIRVKRCVVDHSRVCAMMLVDAGLSGQICKQRLRELRDSEVVKWAYRDYPWKKLPLAQGVFFMLFRERLFSAALKLCLARKMLPK